jgi:hypothetical protein
VQGLQERSFNFLGMPEVMRCPGAELLCRSAKVEGKYPLYPFFFGLAYLSSLSLPLTDLSVGGYICNKKEARL